MDPETAFVAGVLVGTVITMMAMALAVMKPRFEELMAARDHWKARAELAENELGRAEQLDLHIIGSVGWDQPLPDDWLET